MTRAVRSETDIDVVGHRVVHGGPHLVDPVAITPEVHAEIQGVSAFAPLHIQAELEGVNIIEKILGDYSAGRGFRYGISPANARSSDRLSRSL